MRQLVSQRLQLPGVAPWAMYIGAQLFESLLNGVLPERTASYDQLIQKFERVLHVTPNRGITDEEIQTRLVDELEVSVRLIRGLRL